MTSAARQFLMVAFVATALVGGGALLLMKAQPMNQPSISEPRTVLEPVEVPPGLERATFASGCFWCTEAVFQQLKGVRTVVSGYTGGAVKYPSYNDVCTGTTDHAEAVQVTFDPSAVSYADLLEVFWKTHDPTTLHRQGNDVGTQYRSAIFYHSEEQRKLAEHYKDKLNAAGIFDGRIVTEIVPATDFYRAEGYHQNYYEQNQARPYCRAIIRPKLDKLKSVFAGKLKV